MQECIISFDFDETLVRRTPTGYQPHHEVIRLLRDHEKKGHTIVIVTYRNPDHENIDWLTFYDPNRVPITNFVQEQKLPIAQVYYTKHQPKGPLLKSLGVTLHYDDDQGAIDSAEEHGVRGVWIDPDWDGPIIVED
jgi:acid phosphatase class B